MARNGLAVYTGTTLSGLRRIASGGRYSERVRQSRLTFVATAGTTYHVAAAAVSWVDDPPPGKLVLNWYPTPPPEVLLRTPSSTVGGRVLLGGSSLGSVIQVFFNGVEGRFEPSESNADKLLYAWVPVGAKNGPITVVTLAGSDTAEASFTVQIPDPLPALALARTGDGARTLVVSWPISASHSGSTTGKRSDSRSANKSKRRLRSWVFSSG